MDIATLAQVNYPVGFQIFAYALMAFGLELCIHVPVLCLVTGRICGAQLQ